MTELRPAVVVAGTHGKGTTAAMIAFVLRETGRDPAWLIGAPVPQLGSNAGFGEGLLVVEGDESDRTVFGLHALIAVITNVDLDHHTEFRSLAELEAAFERWGGEADQLVNDAAPFRGPLALPGEHNRLNAGSALAALELAGVERGPAEAALALFTGTGRRFEVSEAGGVTIVDDYAHHPAELAATIAAVREAYPGRRVRVLFQPHLYSRTRHLADELGAALAAADEAVYRDLPGPRAADPRRQRQVDRRRARRPWPRPRLVSHGGRRAWPTLRRGPRPATSCSWPAPATWTPLRRCCARSSAGCGGGVIAIEAAVPLSRFTTIGTGGPARCWHGRRRSTSSRSCSAGPPPTASRSRRSASARTCSSTTTASTRSSCGWGARSPTAHVDGDALLAGGGAANAVCVHRARDAGLGGLEFAAAIPGTAGGGVR